MADKRDEKITKGAPAGDAYFRDNHPEPQIYVVSQAEAARLMADQFLKYREQLGASSPKRRKR